MVSISAYLIKSVACAGLLYVYYLFFLKNRKMHQFNRFYLLGSMLLSLLLPFLHFEWNVSHQDTTGIAYQILRVVDGGGTEAPPVYKPARVLSFSNIMLLLYMAISLVMLTSFVLKLIWLYRVRRNGIVNYVGNIRVIQTTTKRAPFSFANDLYWRADMPADDETGNKIWQHELVHIRQKHSIDKLLIQGAIILFWINPFYWLIQRECALLHEFIADDEVNENGGTEQFAMMLLQTHFTGNNSFLVNTFFHSPIKRRIMMLQKNNKTAFRMLRQFLVLPVVAGSTLLFSFSAGNTKVHRAEKRITIVLDAGHGGKDNGAQGINGLYEKDMNFKIVNQIGQMAEDYNIAVIYTRAADENVPLQQRAERAKAANADLLLSIHVNDSVQDGRYQLILDNRNGQKDKSRALASAIYAQIQGMGVKPEIYNKHLVVLNNAEIPAVLLECGDINNKEDVARLNDERSLKQFCANILNGVVAYAEK